jgi:hypothetical protein
MNDNIPDFDPYEMLVKRKQQTFSVIDTPMASYNEDDMIELQTFCHRHGIFGFNCGKMSPKAALQMLKRRMGILDDGVMVSKKQLLKG